MSKENAKCPVCEVPMSRVNGVALRCDNPVHDAVQSGLAVRIDDDLEFKETGRLLESGSGTLKCPERGIAGDAKMRQGGCR